MALYTNTQIDEIIARAESTLRSKWYQYELERSMNKGVVKANDMLIIASLKEAVEQGKTDLIGTDNFQRLSAYLLHKLNKYIYGDTVNSILPTCLPVQILSNPSNQTVTSGASISLSVTATGSPVISYQWQKNGVNISGATSATYNISSSVVGDSGSYRCVVTNPCGTATSTAATVTVNAALVTVTIGWSNTDPYTNDTTPLVITNSQTFSISPGANVIFTGSLAAFADKFMMWSYVATEPAPTSWSNGDPATVLNQGVIPDPAMRSSWVISGTRYICSRNTMTLDTGLDFRLIH